MKRLSLSIAALGLLAATPSHALLGLGVSYGHNFADVKSENSTLSYDDLPSYLQGYAASFTDNTDYKTDSVLTLSRAKVSGLQQIGVKAWIDIPFTDLSVDIGSNVAWGSYKSIVRYDDGVNKFNVDAGLNTGFPIWGIGKGETPYINLLNDLTLRYTFLKLPPLSPLKPLRISAGAGVTLVYGTRVVGKDDIKDIFDGSNAAGLTSEQLQKKLSDKISDNLYTTTWGGHLDLNILFKVPVLPIAIYADGKWYVHTSVSDAASKYPLALSGGLAFSL